MLFSLEINTRSEGKVPKIALKKIKFIAFSELDENTELQEVGTKIFNFELTLKHAVKEPKNSQIMI